MSTNKLYAISLSFILFFSFSHASTIKMDIIGSVIDTDLDLTPLIKSNDYAEFTLYLETTSEDENPSHLGFYSGAITSVDIRVGSFRATEFSQGGVNVWPTGGFKGAFTSIGVRLETFETIPNGLTMGGFNISFTDSSGRFPSSDEILISDLVSQANLEDLAIHTVVSFGLWDDLELARVSAVNLDIDTIRISEASAVPIPASVCFFVPALCGIGICRKCPKRAD